MSIMGCNQNYIHRKMYRCKCISWGDKESCDVLCKLRLELWSEYLNERINNEVLNR